MARTVDDVIWGRAKKRAEREKRGDNIRYIMQLYKRLGGKFKATPLDMVQMGGLACHRA